MSTTKPARNTSRPRRTFELKNEMANAMAWESPVSCSHTSMELGATHDEDTQVNVGGPLRKALGVGVLHRSV